MLSESFKGGEENALKWMKAQLFRHNKANPPAEFANNPAAADSMASIKTN